MPVAAIAVHTFGDFQQFTPHLHIITTDGCFAGSGAFTVGPSPVAKDLEDLARYIIRACFSQERMTCIPSNAGAGVGAKVIYRSKRDKTSKIFGALDWLAQLVTHIPNRYEKMGRYYGDYSNKSRGMRKKAGTNDQVLALVESAMSSKAFRKNWARLIYKVYQIDPLLCPKCQSAMKVISFIEDDRIKRPFLKRGLRRM